MRRLLKSIGEGKNVQKITLKVQDVFHNICRVRDSKHNKKGSIVLASKL